MNEEEHGKVTISRKLERGRETKTVASAIPKKETPAIDINRCFNLETVSKEEFDRFLNEYPTSPNKDLYMGWYSYDDFEFGEWPYSVVAMKSDGIYDEQICYKIAKDALKIAKERRGRNDN